MTTSTKMTFGAGLALAALSLAPSASAQGCVLCYTSVAGGGPAAMRAFTFGVLTLLIPALTLCIAIVLLIARRARNASRAARPVAATSGAFAPASRRRRFSSRLRIAAPHA